MQMKNKLNKTGIAAFLITCCLVFFMLGGKTISPLLMETVKEEIPLHNYVLAEDFPEDKIIVFNNFIRYSAPSEIIDARLGLNNKVSYGDFLSAVSFALAIHENYRSHHAASFLESVLEPLSHDLKTKEFRGYRFPVEDLPAFFRTYACFQAVMDNPPKPTIGGPIRNPTERCMAWHYAYTFWSIYRGNLLEAYSMFLRCRRNLPLHLNDVRFERPYYFHSDEERHQWFLFLQTELRYAGHGIFADQIMEIELEHYRELIVWQLQKRAYLAQRLYEIRDSISLTTLKNLLVQELADLRNNDSFDFNLEKAINELRVIDDKVSSGITQGIIVLPWIDRQDIDRRMGRRIPSEHDIEQRQRLAESRLTRRIEEENIDDETKKAMRNVYDWILCYVRALAIITERLYLEKNLKELTQLHSTLVNNRNVSYTEIDLHLHGRSLYGIREIDEQTRLNIRRFYIIVSDFWGHQFRRENGDMAVGEIILPWVKVRDEWF